MSLEVANIIAHVNAKHPGVWTAPHIATTVALLCGFITLGIGLLRLGWIVEFIPVPAYVLVLLAPDTATDDIRKQCRRVHDRLGVDDYIAAAARTDGNTNALHVSENVSMHECLAHCSC